MGGDSSKAAWSASRWPHESPTLAPKPAFLAQPSPSSRTRNLERPPAQYDGVVKLKKNDKDYGFIQCEVTTAKYGKDVFFHRDMIGPVFDELSVGARVSFALVLGENGEPRAEQLVLGKGSNQRIHDGAAAEMETAKAVFLGKSEARRARSRSPRQEVREAHEGGSATSSRGKGPQGKAKGKGKATEGDGKGG